MDQGAHELGPLLIEIQNDLDRDISLSSLAERTGYSPFHFHRIFSRAIGETPKQHVDRLRLERAVYRVAVTDERFIDIALSLGFNGPEIFTRRFKRAFRHSPRAYRQLCKQWQAERLIANKDFRGEGCRLSEVWFGRLPAQRFLAVRRMRAYLDYSSPPFSSDDVYWRKAADFAAARGLPHERLAFAISYDDPTLTPPDQQRLDACIPCDGEGEGDVRSLDFEGGLYAGAEHAGPHITLIQCYRHVADGIRRSADYVFAEGPPVQIFRHLDPDPARHRCEVYFPVQRKNRQDRSRAGR